mmetsp:Transcript_117253/g.338977  ORF Transcript_117253/g.338977 Transcript_117253/m.338977 type:complete len:286 (+) Transcript_117253:2989-3846(+)
MLRSLSCISHWLGKRLRSKWLCKWLCWKFRRQFWGHPLWWLGGRLRELRWRRILWRRRGGVNLKLPQHTSPRASFNTSSSCNYWSCWGHGRPKLGNYQWGRRSCNSGTPTLRRAVLWSFVRRRRRGLANSCGGNARCSRRIGDRHLCRSCLCRRGSRKRHRCGGSRGNGDGRNAGGGIRGCGGMAGGSDSGYDEIGSGHGGGCGLGRLHRRPVRDALPTWGEHVGRSGRAHIDLKCDAVACVQTTEFDDLLLDERRDAALTRNLGTAHARAAVRAKRADVANAIP